MGWELLKKRTACCEIDVYGFHSDDCSMAKCLADSLLVYGEDFNHIDLRIRFLYWWNYGYCNGTGKKHHPSFGIGISIGNSFEEFQEEMRKKVYEGDQRNSGNGSIMRLTPVPIRFHNDVELAMHIAAEQSLTTHNSEEAKECCRLMTYLIVKFINLDEKEKRPIKELLVEFCTDFIQKTNLKTVKCLAASQPETDWAWQTSNYVVPESRRGVITFSIFYF